MTLKETVSWLALKPLEEKIKFVELFLSEITVMNRSIWSDPETTDKTKVECLKWSNELAHRIWNLLFQLKREEDNNSVNLLVDNINFYRKQSNEFAGHLATTIKGTIERHNYIKEK